MQHRYIFAHMCAILSACQSPGSVNQKLETLKHFFNRRSTGASKNFAHVRSLTLQPGLSSQKFTSEDFLLKNLQSNFYSLPKWTRKPDQVSESFREFNTSGWEFTKLLKQICKIFYNFKALLWRRYNYTYKICNLLSTPVVPKLFRCADHLE